jgi:hypothetical protein
MRRNPSAPPHTPRAPPPPEPLQKHRHDIPRRAAQPLDTQLPRDRIKNRRDRQRLMHIKPRGILSNMVGTSHSWGVDARTTLAPSPRTPMREVPTRSNPTADRPAIHRA